MLRHSILTRFSNRLQNFLFFLFYFGITIRNMLVHVYISYTRIRTKLSRIHFLSISSQFLNHDKLDKLFYPFHDRSSNHREIESQESNVSISILFFLAFWINNKWFLFLDRMLYHLSNGYLYRSIDKKPISLRFHISLPKKTRTGWMKQRLLE